MTRMRTENQHGEQRRARQAAPGGSGSLRLRDARQLGAEVCEDRVLVGPHVALPADGQHGAGGSVHDDARQLNDLLQQRRILV